MTKIIAVTACPSGVAHTYMAAEALESAAKAKGWEVKVETQWLDWSGKRTDCGRCGERRYGDSDQRYRHQV